MRASLLGGLLLLSCPGPLSSHGDAGTPDGGAGVEGGTGFLEMEYVDRPNLRQLSRTYRKLRRPLPFGACARLISQACEGLAWAHDFKDPETRAPLQLVHRDISPDNLMLGSHGVLKVI